MAPNSTVLLGKAQKGDQSALCELILTLSHHVRTVARSIVKDDASADDVAQNTWIRVFRALPQWSSDGTAKAWITRIATNEGLKWRARSRDCAAIEDDEVEQHMFDAGEFVVQKSDPLLRRRLNQALGHLREEDIALLMNEQDGDSASAGALRVRRFRLRKQLRDNVSELK